MTDTCKGCGSTFEPSVNQRRRWCSERCRQEHDRRRNRPRYGKNVPSLWDGDSKPAVLGPLLYGYARVCLLCSRVQGPLEEQMTHERARLLGLIGLPRCTICGGWVEMRPTDIGGTGSPQRGRIAGVLMHDGKGFAG